MKTEQQKALEKIKKCLKLAGSSNANEAAAAMRQAQALMEKYNVTHTDVQASEASEQKAKATVKNKPTRWEIGLALTAADAFGCKIIFSSCMYFTGKGEWKFIGVGASPELASYAFQVLLRQVKKDRAEYIKTQLKRCKPATKTARADTFCLSWILAAANKIAAIAPSAEAKTAIDAYMGKHYQDTTTLNPRVNKGRNNADQSYKDRTHGYESGKQSTLNRGVGGTEARPGLEHNP